MHDPMADGDQPRAAADGLRSQSISDSISAPHADSAAPASQCCSSSAFLRRPSRWRRGDVAEPLDLARG